MNRRSAILLLAMSLPLGPMAAANDYGQHGAVFPVIEADLLSTVKSKLLAMQASGTLDRANHALARRTEAHVRRPAPVVDIQLATSFRSWKFDPTITVSKDLKDGTGRVVVRAGTRVNPLDTVPLRQKLVFLNGDEPEQVAWARLHTTALDAKLILVAGSPFTLMKAEQRRFYFDQNGMLTRHFGIRAVPALVEQQGRALRVSEIVVQRTKGDQK